MNARPTAPWTRLRACGNRAVCALRGSAPDPWDPLKADSAFAELLRRYPEPPGRLAGCGVRLGLLMDFWGEHRKYERACADLGVPCATIDLARPDWIDAVRRSGCDGFMVHPSPGHAAWKAFFDERLRTIAEDLGRPIRPQWPELWIYESKRRMAYWLEAHSVPHPATRVFYDCAAALQFCRATPYPVVWKTDLGSSAAGVRIVRRRAEAERLVRAAFRWGLRRRGGDWRDREWAFVLFQEYVPDAREFRVIQVGASWFAHEKLAGGARGLHSGSGSSCWNLPPAHVWDLCLEVSRRGGFRTMNYDVFLRPDGTALINELQAVFGSYNPSQMYRDGTPGRYVRRGGEWVFEEGLFNRNGSANARVEEFVGWLRERKEHGTC